MFKRELGLPSDPNRVIAWRIDRLLNAGFPARSATPINAATLGDPGKVKRLGEIVPLGRMGTPEEVAEVAVSRIPTVVVRDRLNLLRRRGNHPPRGGDLIRSRTELAPDLEGRPSNA